MSGKKNEKNNVKAALNVLYTKKEKKYIMFMFQDISQIVKNNKKKLSVKKAISIINRSNF